MRIAAPAEPATAPARVRRLRACLVHGEAAAAELVEQATAADREAIDLYRFTHVLSGTLDATARLRLIEMMWQVAYADGTASEFENNLIWRVADLLGVSSHERIALRQRVAGARSGGA